MRRDLINEIGVDADDVAQEIIKKTNFDKKYTFISKDRDKPMSFRLESSLFGNPARKEFDVPGYYLLYKDNMPMCLGVSTRSIANRLARFSKEIHGKSRSDESYPAARKHRYHYGRSNFDGIEVVFCPFQPPANILMEDIETCLIHHFKPIYNVKIRTDKITLAKSANKCYDDIQTILQFFV
jgi:hypothetical protein